MPNVEVVRAIFILQYVQVLSGLNHYFLSYHVHRETDRHTDGHEYSIVAVDKPQIYLCSCIKRCLIVVC